MFSSMTNAQIMQRGKKGMQNQPSSRIHLLKAVSMHRRSFHEEAIHRKGFNSGILSQNQHQDCNRHSIYKKMHAEVATMRRPLKHDQVEVSKIKVSRLILFKKTNKQKKNPNLTRSPKKQRDTFI